jgi:hypothetical protein
MGLAHDWAATEKDKELRRLLGSFARGKFCARFY